ncbi:MAG: hypothetical protein EOP10_26980 [Proteobacteria bacterium]|nr:MAG: hypothetical protein EOP10_26980 [Pseudomonadota bacterium]
MESPETSKPGRLADLQFSVLRFVLYTILTAGLYYTYREILFFDRIARSKAERMIHRAIILLHLAGTIASLFFMNSYYLENGYLLAILIYFSWYAFIVYGARRLQMEWGYRLDLKWTFLFGSFYFQYKANEEPAQYFQNINKWTLTYCTAIAFLIHLYPSQSVKVTSDAMSPTLIAGDHARLDKFGFGDDRIAKVGDLIVFEDLNDRDEMHIGRVHAIPGDTIKVASSNGGPREERMLIAYEYYVLGDNKETGSDSKTYGVIPSSRFVGRADRVLWNFVGRQSGS